MDKHLSQVTWKKNLQKLGMVDITTNFIWGGGAQFMPSEINK